MAAKGKSLGKKRKLPNRAFPIDLRWRSSDEALQRIGQMRLIEVA
jgi:hypothetical protein